MTKTEKLRIKLLNKLSELFQLDQPDLEFGFFKVMHAKAEEINNFINTDLLQVIADAFGSADINEKKKLEDAYKYAIESAVSFNVAEPEKSAPVVEAKAKLDALSNGETAEADVYNHLYRFFERYYDNGDFVSLRYFTRENASKAAPYAIPYNGEEVKLHWANADQYYIKTAEYFNNFTFDLTLAKEIEKLNQAERLLLGLPKEGLKVHFNIVDAQEGEHGNVKASEKDKRFFVLHHKNAVAFNENSELVVNFEYKTLPGNKNKVSAEMASRIQMQYGTVNQGDQPNFGMGLTILDALDQFAEQHKLTENATEKLTENAIDATRAATYKDVLLLLAPTGKIAKRPLLVKYLNQYTSRNTMDYFIHKDLGSFLRRELDFYIKNEVMFLDDIESADVPAVESYLEKIKVIRKIANKLITFLAQLEDFQKKMWLKKKFVVETHYCITLDRVPEALYPTIAQNKTQHDEWVKLYAIDEIQATNGDLENAGKVGYVFPFTETFLKDNDKLMVDTRFFDETFKALLLDSIENFDEQCDGVLMHSENFQALGLMQERYNQQVKCTYIDPPYNAKSSEILYKNSYKHSSWITMMNSRILSSKKLDRIDCVLVVAIDEVEQEVLGQLLSLNYSGYEKDCIVVNSNPSGQQGDNFSFTHEYAYFVYRKKKRSIAEQYRVSETDWDIRNFRDVTGKDSLRAAGPNCFYPILIKDGLVVGFGEVSEESFRPSINEVVGDGIIQVFPIDPNGVERKWRFARNTVESIQGELQVHYLSARGVFDIKRLKKKFNFKSNWTDSRYSANNHGTQLLNKIIPEAAVSFPKSLHNVQDSILAGLNEKLNTIVLDYFAGSGTTAHAVINLNREDNGQRKYILVEMGQYFNTVLKPRIQKVVYATEWKNGKPKNRNTGISHCFKYIRLESYEDTLNNLAFSENGQRAKTLQQKNGLREGYMLNYLLDVETRGSQSLLNIEAFANPNQYTLKVKKPNSDEQITRTVDLIETFNFLIGLRVEHTAAPNYFTASFNRKPDADLPEDQHTKLTLAGKLKQVKSSEQNEAWMFRKVEGWVPANPATPNDGQKEKVLIVWRNLTGDLEQDNLMLDEWFKKYCISTRDFEYDIIYVNGSNNLPNLKTNEENWKVRLIEETFHKQMWDTGDEA